jgi:hypothetical protein
MAKMTPEEESWYALTWDLPYDDLPKAVQLEYKRLKPVWEKAREAEAQARIEQVGPARTRTTRPGSRLPAR